MSRTSRIPGFYKQSVEARRRLLAEAADLDGAELTRALAGGGLDVTTADKTVENVIGTYALPFSIGLNARVNDRDFLVPMVVEEPSVVAAASNASRMIREGGGFTVESDPPWMIAQVQLWEVDDPRAAEARVVAERDRLLSLAAASVPGLVAR
ncbi:MAG: 3-hydroxy-3-methylglutaryl-CoA reductase, partial [Deltaproteobacteria bacterium]|nr:3-hydroxy-3-methylglutaryl-CoA reductase [Deltaproteobacteria bacterium]